MPTSSKNNADITKKKSNHPDNTKNTMRFSTMKTLIDFSIAKLKISVKSLVEMRLLRKSKIMYSDYLR